MAIRKPLASSLGNAASIKDPGRITSKACAGAILGLKGEGPEMPIMARVLLLLACCFAATAQAQATLTLSCKGTTNNGAEPDVKQPISMGIIVNFTSRTVQGFGFPGLIDYPVMITAANDVTIAFSGRQEILTSLSSTQGYNKGTI